MSPSDQNSARENPALILEYYYKRNDCRASSASDANCICWHAAGSGPEPVDSELRPYLYSWRERPPESREMIAEDGAVEDPLIAEAVNSNTGVDVVEPAPRIVAAEAEAGED